MLDEILEHFEHHWYWLDFSEVVRDVIFTWLQFDSEFLHRYAVSNPVVAHIDGFGSFLFAGGVSDTFSGGVVSDDKSCWL